ncbi:MAG: MMPL family transporter, partial [Myxococcota bacterium]
MYRLTRISLNRPRATLAILGAITVVLGAGLPRVHSEYGYRVLIGDDHPSIVALDAFIERFGGGFPIQIGWACGEGQPCDSVFDRASMEMAHAVQRELASAAGVQRVVGPSSASLLMPSTGGFAVRRFVEHDRFVNDAERLAARALDDSLWVGSLIAADASAGFIVVQVVDTREETSVRVSQAIEAALRPHEAAGFTFYLVGDPIANLIVGRDLAESTARVIPFTVLVIGLILLTLSRSWQNAAASLVTMGAALLWTFGLLGWLDWPQDGILEVLAPVIMVVGVCDAVHLLSRYGDELTGVGSSREERHAVLLRVGRDLGAPCLITTLTTALAFLSFVTSDLATFIRFGSISAFGVVACLLLTFTLLPVLIDALPSPGPRSVRASQTWGAVLDAILRASERRAAPILFISLLLLVVCGAGWIGYLRVDTDWRESLGEKSRVVQAMRFMEDRLGQTSSFEIELRLPPEVRLEDPETLAEIEQFAEFLSGLEQISTVTSIADVIRRVNRLLHDDDPAFDRPGDTLGANAEILELIGFEDPALRRSWISFDRSRVRISAAGPEQAVSTLGRVLSAIRRYADAELP